MESRRLHALETIATGAKAMTPIEFLQSMEDRMTPDERDYLRCLIDHSEVDEIEALKAERGQLLERVSELEDYIKCTPEAIECRYNGECKYKSSAALSKIKADSVRDCIRSICGVLGSRSGIAHYSQLMEYANKLESGQ